MGELAVSVSAVAPDGGDEDEDALSDGDETANAKGGAPTELLLVHPAACWYQIRIRETMEAWTITRCPDLAHGHFRSRLRRSIASLLKWSTWSSCAETVSEFFSGA